MAANGPVRIGKSRHIRIHVGEGKHVKTNAPAPEPEE